MIILECFVFIIMVSLAIYGFICMVHTLMAFLGQPVSFGGVSPPLPPQKSLGPSLAGIPEDAKERVRLEVFRFVENIFEEYKVPITIDYENEWLYVRFPGWDGIHDINDTSVPLLENDGNRAFAISCSKTNKIKYLAVNWGPTTKGL